MDSMKSLNTSLPKQSHSPSEQLLQAFKSAALSVTNLYKTAAADQAQAHAEGYQEALEDLLDFLDKENLGLCDGEGWRVRQWMTEKLQGSQVQQTSDVEDDQEDDKRGRSLSPETSRKSTAESNPVIRNLELSSPPRPESAPLPHTESSRTKPFVDPQPPQGDFTFRSTHSYPPSSDSEMSPVDTRTSGILPLRVEFSGTNRSTRSRHGSRHPSRQTSSQGSLNVAAGSKRRLPFPDLFDLGAFGNGKDHNGGGGKRGKFS